MKKELFFYLKLETKVKEKVQFIQKIIMKSSLFSFKCDINIIIGKSSLKFFFVVEKIV